MDEGFKTPSEAKIYRKIQLKLWLNGNMSSKTDEIIEKKKMGDPKIVTFGIVVEV